jgi:hypothetical protein
MRPVSCAHIAISTRLRALSLRDRAARWVYKPGVVDDILAGVVWEFDISQTLLTAFVTLMAIPILMVMLSMTLPARVNRAANLVVASLSTPVSMFNAVGESWTYFYDLGVVLEVIILAFILRSAWTWPRTPPPSMPEPAAPCRSQIQMGRWAPGAACLSAARRVGPGSTVASSSVARAEPT